MNGDLKIHATVHCDVLIIGAGGAALRCGAEILEKVPGASVYALTKVSHPQKSHTSTAQGGLAAVDPKDPLDAPIYHMFDTWKGSDCTADQNVVKLICESAWEQILWLENRGMHFSRDREGRLSKRTFGGHTRNFGESSVYRAVFEADRTGKGIMDTSWGETLKRGITFFNQCIAVELLLKDRRCGGCIAFQQKEGQFIRILAKATIIASGGSGQVFRVTTNCRQNTGDGLALVLQAGLPIMDPEAVQFHPTGIVGPGILASETLRSVGGILRNRDLEPFMVNYAPKMKELAPRDLVARAIESEIREGRGIVNPDHNIPHVWIDLRHLSDEVHEKQIPEVSSFFKRYVNLDTKKDLCPVRPSNHYHMGGIPTNQYGEVEDANQQVIGGLYAVGECAAASFHGFNRLGTNSILELITMGKLVAERVIDRVKGEPTRPDDSFRGDYFAARFAAYVQAVGSESVGALRNTMRTTMTEKVSVFRTEKSMTEAIEQLLELHERATRAPLTGRGLAGNQELLNRWELDNLLQVAMTISQAALHRKESRGAHFRDDYPVRQDAFNYHTLTSMNTFGAVEIGRREIDMSLFKAGGPHHEKFGYIERKY
ncbi:FAD-binding protein [Desulfofustis limnaeus]|jgi:succinate dehydrogenase / fumarate reductase flavoprotein subunit|uniref:Succinate dehydrogenase flavoprotein subunit n=1 Tax=Desulfofustis limnaeus TaxID=2740163 RepID=A0ABN6M5T3_9BACT|nr:FAD-binding protein [Desulfofustis limnaeus]MDX9895601.1 FAD-binding protein [Desulfofustis sp.]BDD87171.1 succinate dehydrogenase flavoprotein subunit [Desulfofustis limnaeus]